MSGLAVPPALPLRPLQPARVPAALRPRLPARQPVGGDAAAGRAAVRPERGGLWAHRGARWQGGARAGAAGLCSAGHSKQLPQSPPAVPICGLAAAPHLRHVPCACGAAAPPPCSTACSAVPCMQASLREQHLLTMLRLLLPWVAPPAAAVDAAGRAATAVGGGGGGADDRLLSACHALLAAAGVHRAAGFEAASASLGLAPGGGVLALLSQLTTAALASPAFGLEGDSEVAEQLLEMWVELVADPSRGPLRSSEGAAAAAAAVFAAVAAQGLQQAAAEALEDEGAWGWACVCVCGGGGGVHFT